MSHTPRTARSLSSLNFDKLIRMVQCHRTVFNQNGIYILAQVSSAGTDICSNMNRTKQRASLRFAYATATPSQIIGSLKLVIKSNFSSFDLLLSSDLYSPIAITLIHNANRHTQRKSELQLSSDVRFCY